MDTNNYVMVAALNLLRQKELGTMPLDAEFTPFDLSALRETPKTGDRFKNDPEDIRATTRASGCLSAITKQGECI